MVARTASEDMHNTRKRLKKREALLIFSFSGFFFFFLPLSFFFFPFKLSLAQSHFASRRDRQPGPPPHPIDGHREQRQPVPSAHQDQAPGATAAPLEVAATSGQPRLMSQLLEDLVDEHRSLINLDRTLRDQLSVLVAEEEVIRRELEIRKRHQQHLQQQQQQVQQQPPAHFEREREAEKQVERNPQNEASEMRGLRNLLADET